jgi:hypothetical protein
MSCIRGCCALHWRAVAAVIGDPLPHLVAMTLMILALVHDVWLHGTVIAPARLTCHDIATE